MHITKLKETMNDRVLNPTIDQAVRNKTIDMVCQTLEQLPTPHHASRGHVAQWYDQFNQVYESSPFYENFGGSTFNSALWLWTISQQLSPQNIVECGTHKGFSSWLLRQANPDAKIQTFDIIHHNLFLKLDSIDYHMMDWAEGSATCKEPTDLVFFDDHVDHSLRIIQAAERGFQYVILDDNFSLETFHATGVPPVPTLKMILDSRIDELSEVQWLRNGKKKNYKIDALKIAEARSYIDQWIDIPELGIVNRRGFQSEMSFVKLKPKSTN
ncbi:MAG: hypothetical protein AAF203_06395, partial [Pseudomonadota bacterium]